ncbi:hypothetical protein [Nocardia sp. NPDC058114]|uniref:hypothetical protein n=1 Tax=Nocardia sp. NPDC058114 TaxID=3346346 RepID=UPI0036DF4DD8
MERGNLTGVSDEIVHALARALQLDDLTRAAKPAPATTRRPKRTSDQTVRPTLQRFLGARAGIAGRPARRARPAP